MANDGAEGWKATRRREPGKPALGPKAPAGQAKLVCTVGERAVAAIVAAEHGDPFGVLGPHQVAPGLWEVRTLQPQARSVTLQMGGAPDAPMERRHEAGLFVARFAARSRPDYRLRIEAAGGITVQDDPY